MAVEISHSSLKLPEELSVILSSFSCQQYSNPVWTFSSHSNGYSLKVFWRKNEVQSAPIGAHSTVISRRKARSMKRLEAFISKKKALTSDQNSGLKAQPINQNVGTPTFATEVRGTQVKACSEMVPTLTVTTSSEPIVGTPTFATEERGTQVKACSDTVPTLTVNTSEPIVGTPTFATEERGTQVKACSDTVATLTVTTSEPSTKNDMNSADSVIDPEVSQLGVEVVSVHSPVSSHTRSRQAAKHKPALDKLPALALPGHLKNFSKYHEDFVRCEVEATAEEIRNAMSLQWRDWLYPGRKVKVKLKDEFVSAEVIQCHFVAKLSHDCLYYYATAKADVRIHCLDSTRELQFRDIVLSTN